jgi:hypothetical protein
MADPADPETGDSRTNRRVGGGKLSRSETVTVRLDPKLRYVAELAARKQRRTLSSFVEWAIEESLKNVHLDDGGKHSESIASLTAELWDVDEPDRFAKLAIRYPGMLTHDEQVLWKLIKENGYMWHREKGGSWSIAESTIQFHRLREHWSTFKKVAQGELPESELPHWE